MGVKAQKVGALDPGVLQESTGATRVLAGHQISRGKCLDGAG